MSTGVTIHQEWVSNANPPPLSQGSVLPTEDKTVLAADPLQLVSVAEVKALARVDSDDEDTLTEDCIRAAYDEGKTYTGRAFLQEMRECFSSSLPQRPYFLVLPCPPTFSVTKVQKASGLTTYEDLTADVDYTVGRFHGQGTVQQTGGIYAFDTTAMSFRVEYTAGYGALKGDVPNDIKMGVRFLAASMLLRELPHYDTGEPAAFEKAGKALLKKHVFRSAVFM